MLQNSKGCHTRKEGTEMSQERPLRRNGRGGWGETTSWNPKTSLGSKSMGVPPVQGYSKGGHHYATSLKHRRREKLGGEKMEKN